MGEFAGKKKKKSSKKKVAEEPTEDAAEGEDAPVAEGQVPWAGSDRDYTYEEISVIK
jgi:hypothetical protein